MPLLNFQSRFAPLVESGEKRQTIRAYRKDGRDPKVGDRLHLWTGLRSKGARKLGEARCSRVRPIEIDRSAPMGHYRVRLAGKALSRDAIQRLAQRDGFVFGFDFMRFFETTHGLPFRGLLIEWKELER